MNIFEEVKNRVDIRDVCGLLGIKLNRNNKCLCPFHKEDTPSFSILPEKNIFNCFGCDEKGDCIKLTSKILGIRPIEAAQYLNEQFHLGIDNKKSNFSTVNRYLEHKKAKERFDKWENQTFQDLCDYYKLLLKWKKEELPRSDRYIEAVKNIEYINYIIDEVFIYGTDEDKLFFKKNNRKVVELIGKRRNI